jgi:hypothetical protein
MSLINGRIARNPLNWVIVGLMVTIAAFGLHIVVGGLSKEDAS